LYSGETFILGGADKPHLALVLKALAQILGVSAGAPAAQLAVNEAFEYLKQTTPSDVFNKAFNTLSTADKKYFS